MNSRLLARELDRAAVADAGRDGPGFGQVYFAINR